MGSGQSVRATHFQRPITTSTDPMEQASVEEHHINISNKMVERLVEDAALVGNKTLKTTFVQDNNYKDNTNIEKLKLMDEKHSKKYGIMVEDLNEMVTRVEKRTANMIMIEPVCTECKNRVLECYEGTEGREDMIKCCDAVGAFSACVEEAGRVRLRAHTEREVQQRETRQRRVAHARNHALRDLGAPVTVQ